MESIAICKVDMAVLPQNGALEDMPYSALDFAQRIMARAQSVTGRYRPLNLIHKEEEDGVEPNAVPAYEVNLTLTLPPEKEKKQEKEAEQKRIQTHTERVVERILQEKLQMERVLLQPVMPQVQQQYHISVRSALGRQQSLFASVAGRGKQGIQPLAKLPQETAKPTEMRFFQVLRHNQQAGVTASPRAPKERQAFPPLADRHQENQKHPVDAGAGSLEKELAIAQKKEEAAQDGAIFHAIKETVQSMEPAASVAGKESENTSLTVERTAQGEAKKHTQSLPPHASVEKPEDEAFVPNAEPLSYPGQQPILLEHVKEEERVSPQAGSEKLSVKTQDQASAPVAEKRPIAEAAQRQQPVSAGGNDPRLHQQVLQQKRHVPNGGEISLAQPERQQQQGLPHSDTLLQHAQAQPQQTRLEEAISQRDDIAAQEQHDVLAQREETKSSSPQNRNLEQAAPFMPDSESLAQSPVASFIETAQYASAPVSHLLPPENNAVPQMESRRKEETGKPERFPRAQQHKEALAEEEASRRDREEALQQHHKQALTEEEASRQDWEDEPQQKQGQKQEALLEQTAQQAPAETPQRQTAGGEPQSAAYAEPGQQIPTRWVDQVTPELAVPAELEHVSAPLHPLEVARQPEENMAAPVETQEPAQPEKATAGNAKAVFRQTQDVYATEYHMPADGKTQREYQENEQPGEAADPIQFAQISGDAAAEQNLLLSALGLEHAAMQGEAALYGSPEEQVNSKNTAVIRQLTGQLEKAGQLESPRQQENERGYAPERADSSGVSHQPVWDKAQGPAPSQQASQNDGLPMQADIAAQQPMELPPLPPLQQLQPAQPAGSGTETPHPIETTPQNIVPQGKAALEKAAMVDEKMPALPLEAAAFGSNFSSVPLQHLQQEGEETGLPAKNPSLLSKRDIRVAKATQPMLQAKPMVGTSHAANMPLAQMQDLRSGVASPPKSLLSPTARDVSAASSLFQGRYPAMGELTYALPTAAEETARRAGAAISQPGAALHQRMPGAQGQEPYAESAYVQTLPDWARSFLKDSFTTHPAAAQPQPMVQSGPAQGEGKAVQPQPEWPDGVYPPSRAFQKQAENQMAWSAPGYAGPPAKLAHKQKERPQQQSAPPMRISDAEINRMANKVYGIIEERMKRDRRRLGL